MSDSVIKVDNVAKSFKLPHQKNTSLKSLLVNIFKQRSFENQQVLKNISFEVKKGEFFGIVGRNGSGKSTLLKMLAGIYAPDNGHISIKGNLTPFIELGVGFNPELTGRENVYLNGALLGFSRKEIESMYQDIVNFAEIERFMDQKLKNYSSGMQVRLAFSIAIRAKSDILVLDEVLAVGDAAFQSKCFDVFAELKKSGTTIVLVTHDMGSVLRFCDRAMLIDKGEIVAIGEPAKIADQYLELNYDDSKGATIGENIVEEGKAVISKVRLLDSNGKESSRFRSGSSVKAIMEYSNPAQVPTHFGFQIFSEAGVYCFGTNTKIDGLSTTHNKEGSIDIAFDLNLVPGSYYITVATMNDNASTVYNYNPRMAEFRVSKDNQIEGVVLLAHKWHLAKK